MYKRQVEEVEKYIKSKDIAVACILIAVYALIAGLQELLYYATSSYDHSTKVIVSAFFDDTLSILAIALLFAAIVWFILKYVFKIEASFSQCLCIYSLKSVVIVPAKIIYTILTMFHVSFITEVGSWFTSFASAFAAILVFFGVRTLCKKENSIPTVVGVAAIGTSLASYIIGLLF